jgi:hypothetical protein
MFIRTIKPAIAIKITAKAVIGKGAAKAKANIEAQGY